MFISNGTEWPALCWCAVKNLLSLSLSLLGLFKESEFIADQVFFVLPKHLCKHCKGAKCHNLLFLYPLESVFPGMMNTVWFRFLKMLECICGVCVECGLQPVEWDSWYGNPMPRRVHRQCQWCQLSGVPQEDANSRFQWLPADIQVRWWLQYGHRPVSVWSLAAGNCRGNLHQKIILCS